MFLLEYEEGKFINADRIDWINLNGEKIGFTLAGEESKFVVDNDMCEAFLNHLQAFNLNISNVCVRYNQLNKVIR